MFSRVGPIERKYDSDALAYSPCGKCFRLVVSPSYIGFCVKVDVTAQASSEQRGPETRTSDRYCKGL